MTPLSQDQARLRALRDRERAAEEDLAAVRNRLRTVNAARDRARRHGAARAGEAAELGAEAARLTSQQRSHVDHRNLVLGELPCSSSPHRRAKNQKERRPLKPPLLSRALVPLIALQHPWW